MLVQAGLTGRSPGYGGGGALLGYRATIAGRRRRWNGGGAAHAAVLKVPDHVPAGAQFAVAWTGPDNAGDFVTIVPAGAPDAQYDNSSQTRRGNPLDLLAPINPATCEVRYLTGRSRTVLGRAVVVVDPAAASLVAPEQVVLGTAFPVEWTGPNNAGDYLTMVPAGTPDGQYRNNAQTANGSPLSVEAPIDPGPSEIRYMSGQGAKILARRPILTLAPHVTLLAPTRAPANSVVEVDWTGPQNSGDYLTIVPKSARNGRSTLLAGLAAGAPAKVHTPAAPGLCEIRHVSGQGDRVLAHAAIEIVAAP